LATAKLAKATAKTSSKSSPKTSKPAETKTAKTPAAEKVSVAKASKPDPKPDSKAMALAGLAAPSKIAKDGLLSEADIIKQSKTDYMAQDQLDFFKHRLRELAAQLRENAGATTEHLRELAVAPDPADRATLEEEHALELRARDRERKLLKKVEGALVRIENGEYGYCEETGEPIGIQRLLARPTATLTIEAQERRELKQKMYGE
jgi:DnaK suppressor protein